MANDCDNKIYYWIKLKKDFFDLPAIDFLLDQENGCKYIVLYQKLCLLSCNTSGELSMTINDILVPYDSKKIAKVTKFDLETVERALDWYLKLGLIFIQENGALKINNFKNMVGKETSKAEIMRIKRQKDKQISNGNKNEKIVLPENGNKAVTMLPKDSNKKVTMLPQNGNNVTEEKRDKSIENRDIDIRSIKEREINKEREIFLSRLERFKSEFSDKNTELSDDLIYKLNQLDIEKLINCVKESSFLKTSKNITLEWLVQNYDKVIDGNYKDYVKDKKSSDAISSNDEYSHLFTAGFDLSELD